MCKRRGCQYFAYPGYTFSYFREFNITDYEAPVSSIAMNEWAHLKAVIQNEHADFYVNDELVLHVDPSLHQTENTRIGPFVDIGTDGYFKDLCIKNI